MTWDATGKGGPYFTMAFIQGPTLHELLQGLRSPEESTCASPSIEELIAYLVQAAETLQYIHDQGRRARRYQA